MSQPSRAIPTNLILGFLGVGKTTAILDLLRQKPEDETWAVLVNEFGEVGIDGALLQNQGAVIREVPGGCMCCVAGLPMQVGLNQLIRAARPDRLLIEPTGLGHPARILQTLTEDTYRDTLAIGPVITLVDPRKLEDPRALDNVQFRDQIAAADILVANKTDLCTDEQVRHFDEWAEAQGQSDRPVFHTSQGKLSPDWLNGQSRFLAVSNPGAHHDHGSEPAREPSPDINEEPWQCVTSRGQGHASIGWRIHPELMFSESALLSLAMDDRVVRFKAVVHTIEGWRAMNVVEGSMTVVPAEPGELTRIELIAPGRLDVAELDARLRAAAGLD